MKSIYSEIKIDASEEKVWSILTNFSDYPNWNPFIKRISGDLVQGSYLEVKIVPPDSKGMTFRPKIIKYVKNKELKWLGKIAIKGLFDGEHTFKVERIGKNKVRFIQAENFRGILVPLFSQTLDKTKRGFEMMNVALKKKSEK